MIVKLKTQELMQILYNLNVLNAMLPFLIVLNAKVPQYVLNAGQINTYQKMRNNVLMTVV